MESNLKLKLCTDHKQSEKLKEILSSETADMHYATWTILDGDFIVSPNQGSTIKSLQEDYGNQIIPCWSLAALLRLMPFHIIENNNRFGFYQVKGFNKQGETYRFGYKTNNDFFLFETSWYNDVIDAAFEMVCWLKENNKI